MLNISTWRRVYKYAYLMLSKHKIYYLTTPENALFKSENSSFHTLLKVLLLE